MILICLPLQEQSAPGLWAGGVVGGGLVAY